MKFSKKLSKFVKTLGKNKTIRRIGYGLGIVIVSIAIAFLTFNLSYQNKILPKTYIGTTNFGGQTEAEAQATLEKLVEESKDGKLEFTWENQLYSLTYEDLSVDYSAKNGQTVKDLMTVGKSGNLSKILKEQLKSIFSSNRMVASFTYDNKALDDYFSKLSGKIDIQEKNATIVFKDDEPVVEPETAGQRFPLDQNKDVALKSIGEFSSSGTPFVVLKLYPKVKAADAEKAIPQARELIKRRMTLKARDKSFQLGLKEVEGLIEFVPKNNVDVSPIVTDSSASPELGDNVVLIAQFSKEKTGNYLDTIAKDVNQEAQDSKFKVVDGKVAAFQVAQTGYAIDKEKAINMIIESLNNNESSLEIPVKVTQPSVSSTDPVEEGLTELVSTGRTSWRGSPPNRIHNLSLGASKISGTIVKPGEEFSTISALKPITAAAGYLPELVIKNSTKVEPDIGGGLCQVSTTLFRAALNAGLKITARTPHSFRVSYYEPPVGMDATVFDPAPDLRFINNYDKPILIWAVAGNNSLEFQIYGTKDSRTIAISDPVKYNYVSPPGAIYQFSDTMAPGAIRQVERATAGVTTSFTYKVTKDGETLSNDTYVSKYVPIADTYFYGTGANVPNVQGTSTPAPPTPTPSPTPFSKVKS